MSESVKDAKARAKGEKAYRKASRPWFKKKRFWLLGLIALIIVIVVATGGGDTDESESSGSPEASQDSSQNQESEESAPEEATPEEAPLDVTAQQLIEDLEGNALAASNDYKEKRVTVTGDVSTIDSSGDYFSITGTDEFTLTSVTINVDESLLETVANFSTGQEVTVTGTVTDVGEIMGYSIDAETIE